MPANSEDGLTAPERAHRERLIATIKALARLVNSGGILASSEEPSRGVYHSGVPYSQQTRTISFTVRADLYDLAHNPQGVDRRLPDG